jgi:hypothetical protein
MWLCAKTMVEGGYKRNLVGHIENSVDEYQLIEKWVDVLTWRNDAYANAYCWAVTKVIDASEPHWVNEDYVELTYEKAVCIASADYLCEILPDDWNSKGIAFLNSFIEYNISETYENWPVESIWEKIEFDANSLISKRSDKERV